MLKTINLERINKILFFAILGAVILYFGRDVLILLTFSCFLAMLMTPVSNKLEKIGISRVFSSLISVFIIISVIFGAIMLLSAQIASVKEDLPQIKSGLEEMIANVQSWISSKFGISFEQQESSLKEL